MRHAHGLAGAGSGVVVPIGQDVIRAGGHVVVAPAEGGSALARGDDALVLAVLQHLAVGVANIRMCFDCDVVLGGELSQYLPPYLSLLRQFVKASDPFSENADYVHITSNNTIFGTRFVKFPQVKAPLVADMSSDILSREIDVSKFGVIYAGAQKNIAPAGVTIVIAKRSLIQSPLPVCPTMLQWKVQDENNSLYNTPPCFPIYIALLVLRRLKALGGIKAINEINEYKAGLLYDFIDGSSFYRNDVVKECRSIMNVPFVTPSKELDEAFVKEAAGAGLVSLKGHRLVGGMRASIYNAMPVEGVKALIEFMKQFELAHK